MKWISLGFGLLLLTVAPFVVSRAVQSEQLPSFQAPTAQPAAADAVVSPDVRPDGTVIFRIFAPKATVVSVRGDWGQTRRLEMADLAKDDTGVWSVTLGPLAPNVVRYTFVVDGVTVVDQRNMTVVAGNSVVQSVVVIPGTGADFMAPKPVAHGAVRTVWYQSSSIARYCSPHAHLHPARIRPES